MTVFIGMGMLPTWSRSFEILGKKQSARTSIVTRICLCSTPSGACPGRLQEAHQSALLWLKPVPVKWPSQRWMFWRHPPNPDHQQFENLLSGPTCYRVYKLIISPASFLIPISSPCPALSCQLPFQQPITCMQPPAHRTSSGSWLVRRCSTAWSCRPPRNSPTHVVLPNLSWVTWGTPWWQNAQAIQCLQLAWVPLLWSHC